MGPYFSNFGDSRYLQADHCIVHARNESYSWSVLRCCLLVPADIIHFHKMTSSNGMIFRVTGPLCGEFTGPGEFPTQGPVTRSFDIFFDMRHVWVNTRDAGDLRCHCTHHDVIIMIRFTFNRTGIYPVLVKYMICLRSRLSDMMHICRVKLHLLIISLSNGLATNQHLGII